MTTTHRSKLGKLVVHVYRPDAQGNQPVGNAIVLLYPAATGAAAKSQKTYGFGDPQLGDPAYFGVTDPNGYLMLEVESGNYDVHCRATVPLREQQVKVDSGCVQELCFEDALEMAITTKALKNGCEEVQCERGIVGQTMIVDFETNVDGAKASAHATPEELAYVPRVTLTGNGFNLVGEENDGKRVLLVPNTPGIMAIQAEVQGSPTPKGLLSQLPLQPSARHGANSTFSFAVNSIPETVQQAGGSLDVTLNRSAITPTDDQVLWVLVRDRTQAISFNGHSGKPFISNGTYSGFKDFVDKVLCQRQDSGNSLLQRKINEAGDTVHGLHAYDLLKTAAEVFLMLECGVVPSPTIVGVDDAEFEPTRLGPNVKISELSQKLEDYLPQGRLPYIERVLAAAFPGMQVGYMHCDNVLSAMVDGPCLLELIWSYWHEEGMLVQCINAIARRFQNIRAPGGRDPLAHLEIAPLRPLNNILWGYIQDEQSRLTVKRRAYEYDHHYGLSLYGKAVPTLRTADSRSKFLEAFHNLLNICSLFYKDHNDTTIIPDAFPLLNTLKEVHLILAQGAHNQHGDLPWTSRAEMLVQQWIMARPEIRDFLQSRAMVPYKEAWMPQVDTMKTLQGWSDVTVSHFRDLGVYGEQILLSVRYGDWIDINDEDSAKNWAVYFRPEIQSYLHAYRAVTGVDLANSDTVDTTPPSVHLRKRLSAQAASR